MKKMKSNCYEGQLTAEELAAVHALLLKPGTNLEEATSLAPPWKTGKYAGRKVSHTTLSKIGRRVRSENIAHKIDEGVKTLEMTAEILKREGRFSEQGDDYIEAICTKIAHRLVSEKLSTPNIGPDNGKVEAKEEAKDEAKKIAAVVALTKVLMKRKDQELARAKFKRETCKVFMDWYEDERARRILESREDAASKLQELGKLIYGEEW